MKVALSVWDGRVSPVFDVSREAVILTVESGATGARSSESIEAPTISHKVKRILDLGVETLICGAISEPLHRELIERGVLVIGFVSGDVEEVIQAFIAGALQAPLFAMPGCRGRQGRFRGARNQGGRRGKDWGPSRRQ